MKLKSLRNLGRWFIIMELLSSLVYAQPSFDRPNNPDYDFPIFTVKTVKLLQSDCGYTDKDLENLTLTFNSLGWCSTEGLPWVSAKTGLQEQRPWALKIHNEHLYAATEIGVFKLNDDGISWNKIGDEVSQAMDLCSHQNVLYAATRFGVFKTLDDGKTWQSTSAPLANEPVFVLHAHGDYLYAATLTRLLKTKDGGVTWIDANGDLPEMSDAFYSLCSHKNSLYLGTREGIFKTSNEGKNWIKIVGPNNVQQLISYDDKLYAITSQSEHFWQEYIFVSDNEGKNWATLDIAISKDIIALYTDQHTLYTLWGDGGIAKIDSGESDWTIVSENKKNDLGFNFCPKNLISMTYYNGYLYIATCNSVFRNIAYTQPPKFSEKQSPEGSIFIGTNDGVFEDIDNKSGWKKVNFGVETNKGLSQTEIKTLYSYKDCLYASTYSGLFRSCDDAKTWNKVQLKITAPTLVAANGYLYAKSMFDGVYATKDGENWIENNNGLENPYLPSHTQMINSLQEHHGTLYALAGDKIFISFGGLFKKWIELGDFGIGHADILCFHHNSLFVCDREYGIFKSSNNGASWTKISHDQLGNKVEALYTHADLLYARTKEGVFVTADDGNTWNKAKDIVINKNVTSLCEHHGYIYAGTFYGLFSTEIPNLQQAKITAYKKEKSEL